MKLKKIVAALAAAAMAVSMTAISAFAATVELDTEYPGAWGASKTIPKSEFEAIGGDVKVVLNVEVKDPLIGVHNHVAKPMNIAVSWDAITDSLQSDTAIAKEDGFFVFAEGQTSIEFIVPESVWTSFKGYVNDGVEDEATAGLAFQVCDVVIKSAELSAADGAQGAVRRVTEVQSGEIMEGKSYEEVTGAAPAETTEEAAPAETTEEAAPAETTEAAPEADTTTTPAATGNAPVAVMVSVMAVAGAAAIAAKKRK